jgi:hypothetical protein
MLRRIVQGLRTSSVAMRQPRDAIQTRESERN